MSESLLSFKQGIQPSRQIEFSQHLEWSSSVLLVLLHFSCVPQTQETNNCSPSLWHGGVKKRFGLVYPCFQLGSSKLIRDWSVEVFCSYSASLEASLAVNCVLDLSGHSVQLNHTEIRCHVWIPSANVQWERYKKYSSVLKLVPFFFFFFPNKYQIADGWQKDLISNCYIYLAYVFISVLFPLLMNPL